MGWGGVCRVAGGPRLLIFGVFPAGPPPELRRRRLLLLLNPFGGRGRALSWCQSHVLPMLNEADIGFNLLQTGPGGPGGVLEGLFGGFGGVVWGFCGVIWGFRGVVCRFWGVLPVLNETNIGFHLLQKDLGFWGGGVYRGGFYGDFGVLGEFGGVLGGGWVHF